MVLCARPTSTWFPINNIIPRLVTHLCILCQIIDTLGAVSVILNIMAVPAVILFRYQICIQFDSKTSSQIHNVSSLFNWSNRTFTLPKGQHRLCSLVSFCTLRSAHRRFASPLRASPRVIEYSATSSHRSPSYTNWPRDRWLDYKHIAIPLCLYTCYSFLYHRTRLVWKSRGFQWTNEYTLIETWRT